MGLERRRSFVEEGGACVAVAGEPRAHRAQAAPWRPDVPTLFRTLDREIGLSLAPRIACRRMAARVNHEILPAPTPSPETRASTETGGCGICPDRIVCRLGGLDAARDDRAL